MTRPRPPPGATATATTRAMQIVSPYPFKTAKAHYEAMLADATARGGPTVYTQATLPDWNGNYRRDATKTATWYHGAVLQIPDLPHAAHARIPKAVCAADVSLRGQQRAAVAGLVLRARGASCGASPNIRDSRRRVMMTPELFQVLNVTAGNFITHVLIGRKFNEDGSVPYLSADVRRWYGETIGFWDGEALVTWTSNIQGWMAHGAFEFSSEMQSIEIYTPRKDARGAVNGIDHEVVLYDPEALVEPVRIVHRWTKAGELNEGSPYLYIECVRYNYPGERQGHADAARHDDRIHRPGHLQPAVGANLGALLRARHGASRSRSRCSDSSDGDPRAETVRFDRRVAALAASFAATLVTPARAHHSFAMYDEKKTYVLTGVVTRVSPDPSHLSIFFSPLNEARDAVFATRRGSP